MGRTLADGQPGGQGRAGGDCLHPPTLRFLEPWGVLAGLYRDADRFWAPGAAIVGDAAHTTHPAGATGMNLVISGPRDWCS